MSVIKTSLQSYFRKHKQFPCPANIETDYNSLDYGISNPKTLNICSGGIIESDKAYFGAVPSTTLSLDKKYSLDAWNRKIKFIINKSMMNLLNDQELANIENTLYCHFDSAKIDNLSLRENDNSFNLLEISNLQSHNCSLEHISNIKLTSISIQFCKTKIFKLYAAKLPLFR